MRPIAVCAVLGLAAPIGGRSLTAQDTLRVLHHAPADSATASSIVTVTFDRPVAPALDSTVRAARLFRMEPAVAGSVVWRDPVTIRFIPAAPLTPGTIYTVTVDSAFRAPDGSALAAPYRFSFRVNGPRLLARSLTGPSDDALPPDGSIRLLYSAPVDLERLQRELRIELSGCPTADTVALRAVRQRPMAKGDPDDFNWAGGYPRDSIANRLRRVVELVPARTLPLECNAKVVIPTTDDDSSFGRVERYDARTARVFRITALECNRWPPSLQICNSQLLTLRLASPMRRVDVLRGVRLNGQPIAIEGGAEPTKNWTLRTRIDPRTKYTITIDSTARDAYGRALEGPRDIALTTADKVPQLTLARGIITAPRSARTIPLETVNARAVRIIAYRIPDSSRVPVMSAVVGLYDFGSVVRRIVPETTIVQLPDRLNADTTTEIPIPPAALAPNHPLVAMRVEIQTPLAEAISVDSARKHREVSLRWPESAGSSWPLAYTLLQITDLAVAARLVGITDGAALVTGLSDGLPHGGVTVSQFDRWGRLIARGVTDGKGMARLTRLMPDSVPPPNTTVTTTAPWRFAVLQAESRDDHVTVSLGGRAIGYEPGSPININTLGAWMDKRPLASGAIFGDRGIYRPGEVAYVKAVVRRGMLGAFDAPLRGDSARVVVRKRSDSWMDDATMVVRDTVLRLSEFGTVVDSIAFRKGLPLGDYQADLQVVVGKAWQTIQSAVLRLAEYRAPQFLVDLGVDSTTRFPGDTIKVRVHAGYLFGAPMRGAIVSWSATVNQGVPPELRHLRAGGWNAGDWTWSRSGGAPRMLSGTDTLDGDGRRTLRLPVSVFGASSSGLVDVFAAVGDVDRQVVTATAAAPISVSHVVVLARPAGKDKVWRVGRPATVEVRAVDIHGAPVRDAVVHALALHHRYREANTVTGAAAEWVLDTVRIEQLRPAGGTALFTFTPSLPGEYPVELSSSDAQGGATRTSFSRQVSAPAVAEAPTGYHLPLSLERAELSVGDTARVHFNSPFADAEAWITLEREGVIEQRRQRAMRGENVVTVQVAERYTPNVFVSVVLAARTDGAARPDTSTERLRVGYVDLHVARDRKRLSVALATDRSSYAPRDTVAVRVRVRDSDGHGVRSEVALWAVDQGVLALTSFRTPDLLSQVYPWRGVGSELWSTLPTMLTNDPTLVSVFMRQASVMLNELMVTSALTAQDKVTEPVAGTVRSQFRSTAFYLGRVETNSRGDAVARASVPDNLTTFRVMAVAISGDRFGGGDTTMLVTRPLVARAALPRFVRPTDSLLAGVVVTTRDTRSRAATSDVSVVGLQLQGPAKLSISLTSGASTEARFVVRAPARDVAGDSVAVRLGATDGVLSDATETWLPVRPDFHPRTHAVIGAVRDSQDVVLALPADIDPARSRLRLRVGTSPLSAMLAATKWLRAYRFDCTEQLTSVGRAIIAVWRATRRERPDALGGDPHAKLQEIADELAARQRPDGAILYWRNYRWTSPWLTAYAGLFLLDAREDGIVVDSSVIARASRFLEAASKAPIESGGENRYEQRWNRLRLGDRVAAVEFLRRAGRPDTVSELALVGVARGMTWEDRLRLAEVIAPRAPMRAEAEELVAAAWRTVTPAGHRVDLPDSSHAPRTFPSRIAPAARLLSASLVLRPSEPLVGGLIETVLQQGRAESAFAWSTQDYSSVVMALAHLAETDTANRVVRARAGASRFVTRRPATGVDTTITAPLTGMLEQTANGKTMLRVHLDASAGERPVYYAVEVEEIPLTPPVTPDIRGIVVERWYERFDNDAPVTRVSEGDLVRVRLRVTVPADREFVALEDPLPAGLEPIDMSLQTSSTLNPFATPESNRAAHAGESNGDNPAWQSWIYGGWDDGHWSPWEHKELHDDRVSYFARMLWTGSYTASYVARATTAGSFVAPPAYAEEMYNPALQGRTGGGRFIVDRK